MKKNKNKNRNKKVNINNEKSIKRILEIEGPEFLKNDEYDDFEKLYKLSDDIRTFLLDSVSKTGGHLSANLGVVELTIALHKVFSSPKDKIIWDVGHQAYIHKILTGRAKKFDTLRKHNGISGFIKKSESVHDVWEAGHSSTSLSAAMGFALARDFKKEDNHVIAVIGDASISNGLSFEALNHIGHDSHKVITILNDNNMAINENVGAFNKSLNKLRRSRSFMGAKHLTKGVVKRGPKTLYRVAAKTKSGVKHILVPYNIFDELGISYYGPIDGHDYKALLATLEYAKKSDRSVVVHVKTTKGKGYKFAENDRTGKWHGVSGFDLDTGKPFKKNNRELNDAKWVSWSELISNTVLEHAKEDERIVAVTPAMLGGSKLNKFQEELPKQVIDVGIAEEHAATLTCAMALEGMKPYLTFYSTFLQRAYDQIQHDIARQNANVLIGIDRAGIVGADGETHQGLYDIPLLRHIPNISIMMPKDALEAKAMIDYAFAKKGPKALRFPRGEIAMPNTIDENEYNCIFEDILNEKWGVVNNGSQINVISFGPNVAELAEALASEKVSANVINARFIKPLDAKMLNNILSNNLPTVIFEEGIKLCGFGASILEFCNENNISNRNIHILALPDKFIQQGTKEQVLEDFDMDMKSLVGKVKEIINSDINE